MGFLMKLHMKKMHGSFVMEDKRMAKALFKAKDKEQNDKLNFHNRCVWEVGYEMLDFILFFLLLLIFLPLHCNENMSG